VKKSTEGDRKAIGQIYVRDDDLSCRLEEAKKLALRIRGVLGVETNHTWDTLVVEYDPEKVTLDQIRKTIANRGMTKTPT
jgi:hypothetical protein